MARGRGERASAKLSCPRPFLCINGGCCCGLLALISKAVYHGHSSFCTFRGACKLLCHYTSPKGEGRWLRSLRYILDTYPFCPHSVSVLQGFPTGTPPASTPLRILPIVRQTMNQSSRCCSLLLLRGRGRGREAANPEPPSRSESAQDPAASRPAPVQDLDEAASRPAPAQDLPMTPYGVSLRSETVQELPGGSEVVMLPDEDEPSRSEPAQELPRGSETMLLDEVQNLPLRGEGAMSRKIPSRPELVPAPPKLEPKQAALLWRCGIAFKDTCCSQGRGWVCGGCQARRERTQTLLREEEEGWQAWDYR